MSYKIRYKSKAMKGNQYFDITSSLSVKIIAMIAVLIFGCSILIYQYMKADKDLLRKNKEITQIAVSNMIEDMREGKSMKEAITAFCQEIIDHGKEE